MNKKLRIAVYTIALNEEQNVDRWVNSVKDADYLMVADTGSTDGTVNALKNRGVHVHSIRIKPWRFDDARNAALSLLPEDIDLAISMDMDEGMFGNWRSEIERVWVPNSTRLRYTYYFSADENNNPINSFTADKAHTRFNYRWQRPVHETVFPTGEEQVAYSPNIIMIQKQDTTKNRGSYLPLLEQSHKDTPNCSQTLFWLAREYTFTNKNDEAIDHFKKYLALPEAVWPDERSEAMKYLSKLLPHEHIKWLRLSCAEAPYRREVWANLADYYYQQQDWINLYSASKEGLKITNKCNNYLDYSHIWDGYLWDLAGIAAYHLNLKDESLMLLAHASSLSPNDQRILSNYNIVNKEISENSK